jgi:polar amino acid transport system permease protein
METTGSGWNTRRIVWALLALAVVVAALTYVVVRLNEYRFDWGFIRDNFFNDRLMRGALMTVFLSVVSQFVGIVLGMLAALARVSKNPVLNAIAGFYIWLFRGTPLLVQLFIFATGLYEIGIKLDLLTAALLAFSINEGAYMAEIVRAGIQSIDPGQTEAAKSLGMTGGLAMRRIVLPQALRVIIPPTGNEFNNMLKSSSLASAISVGELLQAANEMNHLFFKTLEIYLIASCYYLAMTTVWAWVQGWTEGRLGERKSQPSFWSRTVGGLFAPGRAYGHD